MSRGIRSFFLSAFCLAKEKGNKNRQHNKKESQEIKQKKCVIKRNIERKEQWDVEGW
jgi:hypothetical protein